MIAREQAASTSSRICVEKMIAFCLAHPANQSSHFMLLVGIQAVGRLVQNQHFRIVNDRLRKTGAMPIAFGQAFRCFGGAPNRGNTFRRRDRSRASSLRRAFRAVPPQSQGIPGPSCPRRKARSRADNRSGVSPEAGLSSMLNPPTETSPADGGMKPVIMRMVVDLPAPFGPRNPSTSPLSTLNETPFTAVFAPNDFFRFRTLIMPPKFSDLYDTQFSKMFKCSLDISWMKALPGVTTLDSDLRGRIKPELLWRSPWRRRLLRHSQ